MYTPSESYYREAIVHLPAFLLHQTLIFFMHAYSRKLTFGFLSLRYPFPWFLKIEFGKIIHFVNIAVSEETE
jgi:hypothetical protein